MDPKLENFERSFVAGLSSCRLECACGRIFYDDDERVYDWEPGELEKLRENKKATALDYAPSIVTFEGKQYADACDCWHTRAMQIIDFIEHHGRMIARYFELEKARRVAEANATPVITHP